MKLNNKGFAISGTIYALMFLFIILIFATLGLLGSRKIILDKYKQGIVKDIQTNRNIINSNKIDKSGAETPLLLDSMIPITYNGTNWVKAEYISEYEQDWYNYSEQKWANSVVIKPSAIDTYIAALPGTVINENDVLAYYVWIPRFRYKLFNSSYIEPNNNPQVIDIIFENMDDEIVTGEINGEYLSHSAFESYSGFWISKFEATGSLSDITSLPNKTPITNYNLKEIYDAVIDNRDTQGYSLRVLTNNEWSAVAYLTHSIYGIGDTEVRKNSYNQSSGFKTGCGSDVISNEPRTANCEMSFGSSTTYPQSTTGNIYGVFDMSGGVWEYVMAVMMDTESQPVYSQSGFTEEDVTIAAANDRYSKCNVYSYGTNPDDLNRSTIGSATKETWGWYSDKTELVNGLNSWQIRGGRNTDTDEVGIFAFSSYTGGAKEDIGFRLSLVKSFMQ